MVFITEGFFEVAIECWPEWDLNPRPTFRLPSLSVHNIYLCNKPRCKFVQGASRTMFNYYSKYL